jgi:hypothetical protein
MKRPKSLIAQALATVIAVSLACVSADAAQRQLYSWEGGLQGWTAANATLVNATGFGNTDGAQSMLMDNLTGGFKNDAGVATVNSGQAYNAWAEAGTRIAAGDTDVKLEFDFTFDNSAVTNPPTFAQLAIFVNSTGAGFREYGTGSLIGGNIGGDFPTLAAAAVADGVTMTGTGNTRHVAIPMGPVPAAAGGGLNVGAPAPGGFYQVGFKTNGGWQGSVDWAIDNMFISGANITIPEPGSIVFLTIGLAAMLLGWRRGR